MKRNFYKSIIVLLAICLFIYGDHNTYAQDAYNGKHKKTLLWEISGMGMEEPSYLFGTVHIIDSAKFFLDEPVKEKLKTCDKVVFEVNTDDPEYQQKAMSVLMMENDSLDNLISTEEYEKIKTFYAENLKLPLDKLKKIKPYYLVSFIMQMYLPKKIMSYEEELKKLAKHQGKEILGVSTVEKESEILVDRIPLNIQAQMLSNAVDHNEERPEITEKLIEAYTDRDIDLFYKLTKAESSTFEIVFESMFAKRHEVWIPNMTKLMNNHTCFFAVGVAHLAGEDGLIRLLREKGYTVKAI